MLKTKAQQLQMQQMMQANPMMAMMNPAAMMGGMGGQMPAMSQKVMAAMMMQMQQ